MDAFHILIPPVIILATCFIVILSSRVVRISPIVGFLLAGIVLGPHGFEVIEESKTTHLLAELGVVFLLFDIGLHFSMKSAWKLRRDLLGLAPLQMLLGGIILGGSTAFIFGLGPELSLLIGVTLALSSTAVVMQVLGDKKQTESPAGHSAKAVLIFQDIAAIFLLIFADAIGGDGNLAEMATGALGKAFIALAAVIALGRYILTPLMKSMTRFDEPAMFTMLGLLIVTITGLATASVGLSLTLGAFLAGMVLAETPFRALLQSELRPFRSLLLAFFFVTIGMILDPVFIWNEIGVVISLALLLITTKAAMVCALAYLFKQPQHHVIKLSALLCQGSEFAFVIFSMAGVSGALGNELSQQLIAAVAMSMMITPFLYTFAYRWSLKICARMDGICNAHEIKENSAHAPVFILGMSETGKTLARAFKAHDIPYIAVDYDRNRFLEAISAGYIVAYGSPRDMRFWNTLGVGNARAFCAAVGMYDLAREVTPIVNRLWPKLKRYVAVADSADAVRYAALGLKPFNNRGAPPGLEMACHILQEFDIRATDIEHWSDEEQASYLKAHGPSTTNPTEENATAKQAA